jgi:mannose/cellobiose epimerase-like protein (N-acyl-D-glucosamine 2-epimerase family)
MTPDAAIRRTLRDYRALYHAELYERVVPFWLNHSLDREYGGYFNCLDEDGSVYDTRKHVWLQGREVWMMSRLHHHHHRPGEDSPYLQAARLGRISCAGTPASETAATSACCGTASPSPPSARCSRSAST